jgi:hypothetical protein
LLGLKPDHEREVEIRRVRCLDLPPSPLKPSETGQHTGAGLALSATMMPWSRPTGGPTMSRCRASGPRMVCTRRGIVGADARPNWKDRPAGRARPGRNGDELPIRPWDDLFVLPAGCCPNSGGSKSRLRVSQIARCLLFSQRHRLNLRRTG